MTPRSALTHATDLRGHVGFVVGTGRSGTDFITRIVAAEPGVAASHERNELLEAFHRYCRWYDLPVDPEGFLREKEKEIRGDLAGHVFSFESSAYLSLSVRELYERFRARVVVLVRSPERVVNSYYVKGWYADEPVIGDARLAPGYQPHPHFHRYFSRFMPVGEELDRWMGLTRIGRIAWYWAALNGAALRQLESIPEAHGMVVKLEDLDYDRYRQMAGFLGYESHLDRRSYQATASRRPNAAVQVRTIADWSDQERLEFEREVQEVAVHLGYPFRVADMRVPAPSAVSFPARLRRAAGRMRRALAGPFQGHG